MMNISSETLETMVAIIGKGNARNEIATGSGRKHEVKSRHLIPGRHIAEDEKQEDVMEVAVTYGSPTGAIKKLSSLACWKPVSGATVVVKVD